jgi:hypothetical protein
MKGELPIPCELSKWDNKTVLYICPKCAESLRYFGRKQNYCHKCGEKLDWQYAPEQASEETVKKYFDNEKCYMEGKIKFLEYFDIQRGILYEIYKDGLAKKRGAQ